MKSFTRRLETNRRGDVQHLWQVNKYLWMTLGFVLVYLPLAKAQGLVDVSMGVAWAFFAVAFVDGAARSLLAWRRGGTLPDSWSWCFTFLDFALISVAIHLTRGLESDLWLVYFVVMIFESLNATRPQKRLMNASVSLAYLLATLPHQLHLHPMPLPVFLRILCSRLFFLILVSSLARRINADSLQSRLETQRLREQMAAAEERGRIAREVHDGLGHALVSIILRLELCTRLIRKAPEEAESILKEEIPALRAAWNEGRDLAFHLHPWEQDLAQAPLPETLRRHIARFAERTGLRVTLKEEGAPCELSPEAAFGLARIVQEALTNAAKHARASAIEVTLDCPHPGEVVCMIADNGQGFDLIDRQDGFGLQTMRERAESLGGSLQVESAPGAGTKITVVLPQ